VSARLCCFHSPLDLGANSGGWLAGSCQVNFRGQAQERIVVLTNYALYTFAYDFAKRKIDERRAHRHPHTQFKRITYGTPIA